LSVDVMWQWHKRNYKWNIPQGMSQWFFFITHNSCSYFILLVWGILLCKLFHQCSKNSAKLVLMSFLYPVPLLTTKGRHYPSAVCACLISYRKFKSWLEFVLNGYTKSCPENLNSVIMIHCNSFHKKLKTSFLICDIM
jgi:hypothetical protein